MISIKNLSKTYGAQIALNEIDLEVSAGELLVVIGPSGCGKTSLLRSINRMIQIDSGTILVNDKDIMSYKEADLRRQIGYCIQGVGLFPHMSIFDNIAIVPKLLGWPDAEIHQRVDDLMEIGNLPKQYLKKRPIELSGGEAQRVGVLRALAANPTVLLMDEPFGAVDALTRTKLQKAFIEIRRTFQKTVLFVTHDLDEAILLADRIVIMSQGKIIANEPPLNLLKIRNPFVQDFLGLDYPTRLLKRYSGEKINQVQIDLERT